MRAPSVTVEVVCLLCLVEGANILQQAGHQDARARVVRRAVNDGQVLLVQVVPRFNTLAQLEHTVQHGCLGVRAGTAPGDI
jgi:hypothetical protein